MIIRPEAVEDISDIHAINESAFETSMEAELVAALRKRVQPLISLVAEDSGLVLGHILFSPVKIEGQPDLKLMGLAPMSVLPERQRQGIGSALVEQGLDECRQLGYGAVVVLGHPDYYPRFGFQISAGYGIRSEYDVPEDVFMLKELIPGYLNGVTGTVRYHELFNKF